MQPGFTCQRCLRDLSRRFAPQDSVLSTHRIARRRWKSTTHLPTTEANRPVLESPLHAKPKSLSKLKHGPFLSRTQAGVAFEQPKRLLLEPDNLFHPFSGSPLPDIRKRAAFMKTHAYCPHPSHHKTRLPASPDDLEARKVEGKTSLPPAHVRFECPDCGIPVYCSEDHWADDYESHMDICDQLRESNEDDHDLRSGRVFPEFEYPPPRDEEILVNLTNWDTYMYTRDYTAINEARPMRQATRLLTYPLTIASVLHELSPYNIRKGGRLTMEGLKSLTGKYSPLEIVSANREQHYNTPCTHRKMAQAQLLKIRNPLHLQTGYLFSALEPTHPYLATYGSS